MSYETDDKMVSHPDHYKSGRYEVIDIIDEFTKDLSGTEAVCTANAIKYILRWKKKNGIQDVKKAIWYLQHMVDKEEERHKKEEFVDKAIKFIKENSIYGIQEEVEKKGIDDEPDKLNLRKNAAGVYIPEDTTKVPSFQQVAVAASVITNYCESRTLCGDCPFFDPDANDVSCKFRLHSPNAWRISPKDIS